MSIPSQLRLCSWLGVALVLSFSPLQQTNAQDRGWDLHGRGEHDFHDHGGPVPEFRDHDFPDRRFLDSRYHHDHYYPPLGFVVGVLPSGYRRIYSPHGDLFFSAGSTSSRNHPRSVVGLPPSGQPRPPQTTPGGHRIAARSELRLRVATFEMPRETASRDDRSSRRGACYRDLVELHEPGGVSLSCQRGEV
jgi:hypothetical protein